jgi:N6-adenosine-specific RNA methylase IME4
VLKRHKPKKSLIKINKQKKNYRNKNKKFMTGIGKNVREDKENDNIAEKENFNYPPPSLPIQVEASKTVENENKKEENFVVVEKNIENKRNVKKSGASAIWFTIGEAYSKMN